MNGNHQQEIYCNCANKLRMSTITNTNDRHAALVPETRHNKQRSSSIDAALCRRIWEQEIVDIEMKDLKKESEDHLTASLMSN